MSLIKLDPKATTFPTPERLDPKLLAAARELDAATLHEAAGKIGVLPSAIKPVVPGFKICGTGVMGGFHPVGTVQSPENLQWFPSWEQFGS